MLALYRGERPEPIALFIYFRENPAVHPFTPKTLHKRIAWERERLAKFRQAIKPVP